MAPHELRLADQQGYIVRHYRERRQRRWRRLLGKLAAFSLWLVVTGVSAYILSLGLQGYENMSAARFAARATGGGGAAAAGGAAGGAGGAAASSGRFAPSLPMPSIEPPTVHLGGRGAAH